MNKTLIALAAAFLAATAFFGPGAEAGFNVRLGAPAGFSTVHKAGCGGRHRFRRFHRRRRHHRSVSRRVKHKTYIAKTDVKPEPKAEAPSQVVDSENSSIATASTATAQVETAAVEKKVVAAKNVGCKQFFAAVGMTLSVRCD